MTSINWYSLEPEVYCIVFYCILLTLVTVFLLLSSYHSINIRPTDSRRRSISGSRVLILFSRGTLRSTDNEHGSANPFSRHCIVLSFSSEHSFCQRVFVSINQYSYSMKAALCLGHFIHPFTHFRPRICVSSRSSSERLVNPPLHYKLRICLSILEYMRIHSRWCLPSTILEYSSSYCGIGIDASPFS